MTRLHVPISAKHNTNGSKGTKAFLILLAITLGATIYLFEKSSSLAQAAGCQLGETCFSGDGLIAAYYGMASIASLGLLILETVVLVIWGAGKFVSSLLRASRKKKQPGS